MKTARLFLLILLAASWPATAHASWLSWLEELSGPGPFRGYMLSFTLACVRDDNLKACPVGDAHEKQTVVVRLGRLNSEGKPRFKDLENTPLDDRRDVHAVPVSFLYLFRVHRAIEIGPGAGFMHVSGEGFKGFSKLSLTPLSGSFTPLSLASEKRWAYALRIEFENSWFPQGFSGSDFSNPNTSFDSGAEFLTRAGFVIDLGALIGSGVTGFHK